MTYSELQAFSLLRKVEKLGPWSTYLRLLGEWKDRPDHTPTKIAEKTIRFYRYHFMNRHKATIMTPAIHLSSYNPDDNRHDLRPFLYPDCKFQYVSFLSPSNMTIFNAFITTT